MEQKVDILMIQETKMNKDNFQKIINSFWPSVDFLNSDSIGALRGIATL